jgi:transcriptional regulator with XRE-family HTH domain
MVRRLTPAALCSFSRFWVRSSSVTARVWGNTFPHVKEHIPQGKCSHLDVAKLVPNPRTRLAKNLAVLIETQGLSAPQVAEAAKVDRKSINNLLNSRFDPRLTLIEKVANVFGLTTWQLLAHDFELNRPDNRQVLTLLEHYSTAKDEGRRAIMQVAEIAAQKG